MDLYKEDVEKVKKYLRNLELRADLLHKFCTFGCSVL